MADSNLRVISKDAEDDSTPPQRPSWKQQWVRLESTLFDGINALTGNFVLLFLFAVGLVFSVLFSGSWFHGNEASGWHNFTYTLCYLSGMTLLVASGIWMQKFLPNEGEGRSVFVLLSLVNFAGSALTGYMVYKGLVASWGESLSLAASSVAALFFFTGWLVAKIMVTEKVDAKRAVLLPFLVPALLSVQLVVEVPPSLEFSARDTAGIEGVRTSVQFPQEALGRAQQRLGVRNGMPGILEAQIGVLKVRQDEEEKTGKGQLAKNLEAAQQTIQGIVAGLQRSNQEQQASLDVLNTRLSVITKKLVDGDEMDANESLQELIAVQAAANAIITDSPEAAVRGVISTLRVAMDDELARTAKSRQKRITTINAHISALNNIEGAVESVIKQAESIQPYSERPKPRGTLEIIGDAFKESGDSSEALNLLKDFTRVVFFVSISFFAWLIWAAYYRPDLSKLSPEERQQAEERVANRRRAISRWFGRVMTLVTLIVLGFVAWTVYVYWGADIKAFWNASIKPQIFG